MAKFMLSAFGDEISPVLSEQVAVLKTHSITGLEFRSMEEKGIIFYSTEEIEKASLYLQEQGIAVSALGSPIGKVDISDDFEAHLELFYKAVTTAKILKTNYIRMFSFFIPKNDPPEKYRDIVMDRWKQFEKIAKQNYIILLHENEKEIFGDTPERCLDIMQEMNSPYVRNIIDPANYIQVGSKVFPEAWDMLKDYTDYMHIKDARWDGAVVPAGEGDGKIFEILKELYKQNYSGWLSIEPHLGANSQPGGGELLFAKAANALKGLLNRLDLEMVDKK